MSRDIRENMCLKFERKKLKGKKKKRKKKNQKKVNTKMEDQYL